MQYTINLYKVDEQGFLVARACVKSALQLGGNNNRDSRLGSAENPEWNTSPWFAPVPADERFYRAIRELDLKRILPDLSNPEVVKSINENELDLRVMRAILATDEKSYGGMFLRYLMSYPRWVNAKGEIEVGGADYFAILSDRAEAERRAGGETDASHIATISERRRKRMEALATVAPEELTNAFAELERQKRDGIDDIVRRFRDFVNMVGLKSNCNAAAQTAIAAIDKLVRLLDTCGINDFNVLDKACNEAEDALADFCTALAAKEDEDAKTPQEVILSGEQAEQLKTAATKSAAAASNSESAKRLIEAHCLPRKSDYQVSQPNLSQWLEEKNVATTVRQIQRWEQYLKTDGTKGTKPPDGYTLQTRLTPQFAQAWVDHYATQERGKLSTRNYFDERTASRDRKPAKPTHGKAT